MRKPGRFPTDEGEMVASSMLREADSFPKTKSETLNLLNAMRKIPTTLNQPTSEATQHYQQSNNNRVDEQPIAHNNESLFSKAMRFGEELSRFVKRRINGIFEFVTKGIDGILALFQRF